jgi:ketosteroid isomerase-like protein
MKATLHPADYAAQIFAALDAKDVSALAEFVTDDVRLRMGNGDAVEGKDAFLNAVEGFNASIASVRHDLLNVWADGDAMIIQLDVTYERHDGGELTLPCCHVFRVRGDAVAEYLVYMDIAQVYT